MAPSGMGGILSQENRVDVGTKRRAIRSIARLGPFAWTLLIVLTLNFLLPRAMPGDPITALLEPDSTFYASHEATREALLAYYGLDQPLHVQYGRYLAGLLTGDLGWSIRHHRPVVELLASRLPWTLGLCLPAVALASAISLFAGAHAGWQRGTLVDRALIVAFASLHTLPAFFLGTIALVIFSVNLGWLPLGGGRTPFAQYGDAGAAILDLLRHWLLPVTVLTVQVLGGQFLLMRNSTIAVLGEDYMLVARAKGLSRRRLKYYHAVRNALLPFVTACAMQFGIAVAGTIVIESLFAYPGIGWLTYEAVGTRDYPVLQGVFLLSSVAVLVANLLADAACRRLDPRIAAP